MNCVIHLHVRLPLLEPKIEMLEPSIRMISTATSDWKIQEMAINADEQLLVYWWRCDERRLYNRDYSRIHGEGTEAEAQVSNSRGLCHSTKLSMWKYRRRRGYISVELSPALSPTALVV